MMMKKLISSSVDQLNIDIQRRWFALKNVAKRRREDVTVMLIRAEMFLNAWQSNSEKLCKS